MNVGLLLGHLGRTEKTLDGCVVTKPKDKHVQNMLGKFGMEDANPGVLPRSKLELPSAGSMDPLTTEEKKIMHHA